MTSTSRRLIGVLLALFLVVFVLLTAAPNDEQSAVPAWRTLGELAAHIADDIELPGVAIAWARLGGEPEVSVAGVRMLGLDEPVEPADRFHIGSITKSVTASVLGALVEKGELSWQATLRELLPEVEMNEAFAAVELHQLLRHRARIPQYLNFEDGEMARLNALPGTPTAQRAAFVKDVLARDAIDEGYHYSNAGYVIAGSIAERASGRSWEQLVHDEVFAPLRLATCGIGWPATAERPDQPRGHFGGRGRRSVQGFDAYELGPFLRPAGGIHCSVGDLTRYGLAHLAGLSGDDGFLGAATIQELHRLGDGESYAAGWRIDPETGQHHHNGTVGSFFAYLTIDPEVGLVVAFLTNAGPPDGHDAALRAVGEIFEHHAHL